MMTLPIPPAKYDANDQAQMRRTLTNEDEKNFKRGGDMEIADGRIIIRTPNGSRRYLTVADDGTVGSTAL